MSSTRIAEPMAAASPRFKARAAGAFWSMTILMGIVGMLAGGRLLVPGNAAATSSNILEHQSLYRLGSAADLIGVLCYVAVTLFIYELFKPVNRSLSLLGAFFSLVGCAVGGLGCVLQTAPLLILGSGHSMSVFTTEQLQTMALLVLRLRVQSNGIGLVFFGLHCGLVGYLIFRSAFLPRMIGAMMLFAGLGWLTYLFPPLASSLFPWTMAPGILGETSLALWLLIKGVNIDRWREQATAMGNDDRSVDSSHRVAIQALT